jgi:hypothetical protein
MRKTLIIIYYKNIHGLVCLRCFIKVRKNSVLIEAIFKNKMLDPGLPSDKVSNGVQKVPNGVHVRYKFFLNGVHLWGT